MIEALARELYATSALEALAVVLGVIYLLLILKRNRLGWVAGAGSSAIYVYLSARARLPMQSALQVYYVLMAAYGWRVWTRSQQQPGGGISRWPLQRHAGAIMLWCVCGFGICTVVFGLSRTPALSLAALALIGACDMVSVIVRHTLVQLSTPDEMRGRVSAVNMVFIGASNEVGQFESGVTAQWFGTVPAVVLGGLGTIAIVALWAWRFPALRRVDALVPPAGEG